jgi:hypothetical protein
MAGQGRVGRRTRAARCARPDPSPTPQACLPALTRKQMGYSVGERGGGGEVTLSTVPVLWGRWFVFAAAH